MSKKAKKSSKSKFTFGDFIEKFLSPFALTLYAFIGLIVVFIWEGFQVGTVYFDFKNFYALFALLELLLPLFIAVFSRSKESYYGLTYDEFRKINFSCLMPIPYLATVSFALMVFLFFSVCLSFWTCMIYTIVYSGVYFIYFFAFILPVFLHKDERIKKTIFRVLPITPLDEKIHKGKYDSININESYELKGFTYMVLSLDNDYYIGDLVSLVKGKKNVNVDTIQKLILGVQISYFNNFNKNIVPLNNPQTDSSYFHIDVKCAIAKALSNYKILINNININSKKDEETSRYCFELLESCLKTISHLSLEDTLDNSIYDALSRPISCYHSLLFGHLANFSLYHLLVSDCERKKVNLLKQLNRYKNENRCNKYQIGLLIFIHIFYDYLELCGFSYKTDDTKNLFNINNLKYSMVKGAEDEELKEIKSICNDFNKDKGTKSFYSSHSIEPINENYINQWWTDNIGDFV